MTPYSAEELSLLRRDVSYRNLRNGRWFATLDAIWAERDALKAQVERVRAYLESRLDGPAAENPETVRDACAEALDALEGKP